MLVAHHFTNPNWFDEKGHWWSAKSVEFFEHYVAQLVEHFGDLVDNWNTFNEPAVYLVNGMLIGNFPPFKNDPVFMYRSLKNMARANEKAVAIIKESFPDVPVGISKNTVCFYGRNALGKLPANLMDRFFNKYVCDQFIEPLDYLGVSYYAKIGFDPLPITFIDTPAKLLKLGLPHDGMWEYYPEGMGEHLDYFWDKYKKPIIITESGICTNDSEDRIESIKDYLSGLHQRIENGMDIRGYFHWSTMDNFEWNLGPTFRFGLIKVDFEDGSFDRTLKPCGSFYQEVIRNNGFDIT